MRAGLALCIVVVVGGCTSGSSTPPSTAPPASALPTQASSATAVATPSPSPSSSSATPSGVIAIGHSGLTGEGTVGESQDLTARSWATGSAAEVNSVWLRLKAVRPDLAGEAINRAQGGAPVDALPGQITEGLLQAPHPALVIISTIDNDIRCDGTDPQRVPAFGSTVDAVLHQIVAAEPRAKILVVGQLGRPSIPFLKKVIAADPSVAAFIKGTGMCDFLDPDGTPNPAHIAALTAIIDSYEAEEARVCSAVPQCRTDGGVRKAYVDVLENFSPDHNHLNVKGQAAEAALIWPVVEDLVGL